MIANDLTLVRDVQLSAPCLRRSPERRQRVALRYYGLPWPRIDRTGMINPFLPQHNP